VMYLGSNGGQPDLFTMNPGGSHLTPGHRHAGDRELPKLGTHPLIP
jgi:hypothetical protein